MSKFTLPPQLPIHLHIAYAISPDGKNIFQYLDESRKKVNELKREFYESHPELDPRKSDIIKKLKSDQ